MTKKIANDLVGEFIAEQILLDEQTVKVAALKEKLRKLNAKGQEHKDLSFEDNVSFRPDWKLLVTELADRYMTKGVKSIFFNKTLKKRFPPIHGRTKVSITAVAYKTFKESLNAKKKKLGLVAEE